MRSATGTRIIGIPGLPNVRDVGGLRGPAGNQVGSRLLLRGPAPEAQTAAGVFRLGIRTVVDLRRPDERSGADVPVHRRIRVLHRPLSADMTGIRGVFRPQPHAYLAWYRLLLPQAAAVAAEVIGLLSRPASTPLYLCCTLGKDRTGVVCALVLRALRVRLAEVGKDYALTARCYRGWDPGGPLPAWAADHSPRNLAARTATSAHTVRLLLTDVERAHRDLCGYLQPYGLRRSVWGEAMRRLYPNLLHREP